MNLQSESIQLSQNQHIIASKRLKKATQILFCIAIFGQMMFVYHIVTFYGGTALAGKTDTWDDDMMMFGIVEGDLMGNIAIVVHVILAAIITFGGPLQFIESFRKRFPVFHRWNGRLYVMTAFLITLAGLYLVYSRGVIGDILMATGNTLNASMIMFFSVKMWHTAAVKRDFVAHKRWALRTFLAVSGVWFFRVGYGLWIAITLGEVPGMKEDLSGNFDLFLVFAHALLPVAILELYFLVKKRNMVNEMRALTVGLGVLGLLLAIGVGMASVVFWI